MEHRTHRPVERRPIQESERIVLELDPDLAHFMFAAPFPGTELWKMLEAQGQVAYQSMDWSQIAIQDDRAHFDVEGLGREAIERKWHEAHRRFYVRPRRVARLIGRRDTWARFPYYARQAAAMLLGLGERR